MVEVLVTTFERNKKLKQQLADERAALSDPELRELSSTMIQGIEAEDVEVHLDEAKDLQVSIAASGGPGGQGVNTTNSAMQLLHKPTGMIVKCQDERAEKIRTYNVPQNRITDHRIQLTLHKLDRFLDGALEDVIVPLRTHHQAERLRRELGIETGVTTAAMGGGDD